MNTMTTNDILNALGISRSEPQVDWVTPTAIFGLGVLTGAATAALLTPRSGPEMRREIASAASNVTDAVAQKLPSLPESLSRDSDGVQMHHRIEAK
jgi:hypothetical protein